MNDDELFWDKPSLNELLHYGTLHRSGRYKWGSGDEPYQRGEDFLARVEQLRNNNFEYTDDYGKKWTGDNAIAKSMKLSTTEFRIQYKLAKDERRIYNVETAKHLRDKEGLNTSEIGKKMGVNESTVRSWFNAESESRMVAARNTADFIRSQVDKKDIIDIGKGAELSLGVSRQKFDEAVYMLEMEGYKKYGRSQSQVNNPGQQTILQVLCKPGTEHSDIYNKPLEPLSDYISHDNGETFHKAFDYPQSLSSKRLKIRYADEVGPDGSKGIQKDGLMEIRRGCKDLDLGNSTYAQVRILVDGTHYLKGMAIYSDDLPKGTDIVFNTNKAAGTPVTKVLKKIKEDPENPFGAAIKEHGGQYYYTDKDGKEKLGLINKTREEGDWNDWADKLPSQFLAKQNISLIRKQLDITKADSKAEFDDICALTNPTIKKALLQKYADGCDSAAVHLKAASLPRQKFRVITPIPSLKDDEIYAPTYENGEKVALIRYPHAGTFEIPILTVNNKHVRAKKVLGNALDAVGINNNVADRLSGADFDGDTVQVIPTAGNGKNLGIHISSRKNLDGLSGFDPKVEYGTIEKKGDDGKPHYYVGDREIKVMKNTNMEMGKISNLITDMTIRGANDQELARAVRHSMVVIDAEKHKLDYKRSEIENDIPGLKKLYQAQIDSEGNVHYGASTLMSKAKSPFNAKKRQGSPHIDPETGEKVYKQVEETYIDKKTGKTMVRTTRSTKMAEAKDAHTLSSGTIKEEAYADYANSLKSIANQARKEILATGDIKYNSGANLKYKSEVTTLEAKLRIAKSNAPKERIAQARANEAVKVKKDLYMDSERSPAEIKKDLKKLSQQELTKARAQLGAHKEPVVIEDKEWEAIQSGAISPSMLKEIINNSDLTVLRQRAMPKGTKEVSASKISRIKAYGNSGYTIQEIAKALGLSTSTVSKYIK